MKRTHKCNQVTEDLIGQEISVTGWIHRRRDHGGVIFFDLRDEDGLVHEQDHLHPLNQRK